jgi:hypothetical protein
VKLGRSTHRTRLIVIALLTGFLAGVGAGAQEAQPPAPAAALSEALMAACRQNESGFARYLTAENAATFRQLPPAQRVALLQRFTLMDHPGRPLLSNDPQGHPIIHCEAPEITVEMRSGDARQRDNLAFIPVEVLLFGETAEGASARKVEFGLVREGSERKLLSMGLLLLNLAELSRQWEAAELQAREKEAIATLRKLANSISTYRRAFGRLPESLAELGPAPKEGISPDAAGLVDAELAQGMKAGYVFRYRIVPASGESAESGFGLAATPTEYGKTGRRSFFLDPSGTLRGADKKGAVATITDPRIEPR